MYTNRNVIACGAECDATSVSPVDAALNATNTALIELRESLGNLESRLDGVLRSPMPNAPSKQETASCPPSRVVAAIELLHEQVDSLLASVNDLNNRLTV